MADPRDFDFWVEDDCIRVRFANPQTMPRTREGHQTGGDYLNQRIRLARGEYRYAQQAALMHELGHYLIERGDYDAKRTTEEEMADLLSWLPFIFRDDRNGALLAFLDLRRA